MTYSENRWSCFTVSDTGQRSWAFIRIIRSLVLLRCCRGELSSESTVFVRVRFVRVYVAVRFLLYRSCSCSCSSGSLFVFVYILHPVRRCRWVFFCRATLCVKRALVIRELRTAEPVKRDPLRRTFAANCK